MEKCLVNQAQMKNYAKLQLIIKCVDSWWKEALHGAAKGANCFSSVAPAPAYCTQLRLAPAPQRTHHHVLLLGRFLELVGRTAVSRNQVLVEVMKMENEMLSQDRNNSPINVVGVWVRTRHTHATNWRDRSGH